MAADSIVTQWPTASYLYILYSTTLQICNLATGCTHAVPIGQEVTDDSTPLEFHAVVLKIGLQPIGSIYSSHPQCKAESSHPPSPILYYHHLPCHGPPI